MHGLDPATAAPAATSSPSELVPSLPLAATSPALCGKLTLSTATMPMPPSTGTGLMNAESDNASWALAAGALLGTLAMGTAVVAVRRSR